MVDLGARLAPYEEQPALQQLIQATSRRRQHTLRSSSCIGSCLQVCVAQDQRPRWDSGMWGAPMTYGRGEWESWQFTVMPRTMYAC